MKREILFKGIVIDESTILFGEWFYGDLIQYVDGTVYIRQVQTNSMLQVNPETVCQFIGLCDKNGNKIFEGDKINFSCAINGSFIDSVVEYDSIDGAWSINWDKERNRVHYFFNEIEECEIIGNIHN